MEFLKFFGSFLNFLDFFWIFLIFLGFDSFLSLRGISWDDKTFFFQALEESISGIDDLSDEDSLKIKFKSELAIHSQSLRNFKLKLGHKNVIVNLCHELQKTSWEEFSQNSDQDLKRKLPDDEHGYSRDEEGPLIKIPKCENSSEIIEQDVQYVYEDEDSGQFFDSEYLDGTEVVEYGEVIEEGETEGVLKQESFQEVEDGFLGYVQATGQEKGVSPSKNVVMIRNNKKPKHMYSEDFLMSQNHMGRIGKEKIYRRKFSADFNAENFTAENLAQILIQKISAQKI